MQTYTENGNMTPLTDKDNVQSQTNGMEIKVSSAGSHSISWLGA